MDGLVCNAGALHNERKLTDHGIEVTFASHLLYGSYLMTQLAQPFLRRSSDPRVVMVSSGGMLNTPFPKWEVATAQEGEYDGQYAYAYAKRGQVLLCERWAAEETETAGQRPSGSMIKFVSCHPGWCDTAAVELAYGAKKSYLEPMRSTWEGAEGIAWLAAVSGDQLEGGGFYLDRSPQVKHMAGAFFSEGSYTKNSEAEVDRLLANLEAWANRDWAKVPSAAAVAEAKVGRLPAMATPIDVPKRFMGRWFVVANIPTYFEVGATNLIEDYIWNEEEQFVQVRFSYTKPGGAAAEILQRATVVTDAGTEWAVSPKMAGVYLPLNLGYIITHCEPDYSYSIVGLADRSNLWVLSRTPRLPPAQYAEALRKVESQGFDMSKVLRVQNPMHENESAAGSIGGGTVFQDIAAEPQAEKTSL